MRLAEIRNSSDIDSKYKDDLQSQSARIESQMDQQMKRRRSTRKPENTAQTAGQESLSEAGQQRVIQR